MRNNRYTHPDRPAVQSPYETLTVGRLVASLLAVPVFVAVLAVPTLVVAATLGAASALLVEKAMGVSESGHGTTESTGDATARA